MQTDTLKHPRTLLSSLILGALVVSSASPALMPSAHAQTVTTTTTTAAVALMGSSRIQPNVDTNPSGMAEAFQFYARQTGTSSQLNVYIDAGSTATRVVAGVYVDGGGQPAKLLGTAVLNSPKAGAWNAVAISPIKITTGTRYWIALLTPPGYGTVKFRDVASGGGRAVTTSQTNLTAMPTSWVVGRV